jgi:fucokinase
LRGKHTPFHDLSFLFSVLCPHLSLKLVLVQCGSEGQVVERIEVTDLSHMLDYSQPHAPGALMKAAFVCAGVVEVRSSQSLAEQLSKYGSGFELTTISNIPQGSGLGTSSILGGAIMAALWRATGQKHTKDSLIHAVGLQSLLQL